MVQLIYIILRKRRQAVGGALSRTLEFPTSEILRNVFLISDLQSILPCSELIDIKYKSEF